MADVHRFTIGGSKVQGFKVLEDGSVEDFEGTLRNFYNNLNRASVAARRKYQDPSITVVSCEPQKKRYEVDINELLQIAKEID